MKFLELFRTLLVGIILLALWVDAKDSTLEIKKDTVLTSSLIVSKDQTCIIHPGTTLRFDGYCAIIVSGLLIVKGEHTRPVRITTIGRAHGSKELPTWKGIELHKGSEALLRHCRIEGAFRNAVYTTKPVFDSCEFVGNHYALYCVSKATPHIKSCVFTRNKYGIVANFSSPLLLDNRIMENYVGLQMMVHSRLIAGRNIITGNTIDIQSEEGMGKNHDATSLKEVWDLMSQLY